MTPQFSPELGGHWISKIRQADQPVKKLGPQVTYQESYRNSKITPSRIRIRSLYLLELELGSTLRTREKEGENTPEATRKGP
jgi:hypothetical protein